MAAGDTMPVGGPQFHQVIEFRDGEMFASNGTKAADRPTGPRSQYILSQLFWRWHDLTIGDADLDPLERSISQGALTKIGPEIAAALGRG